MIPKRNHPVVYENWYHLDFFKTLFSHWFINNNMKTNSFGDISGVYVDNEMPVPISSS